MFGDYDKCKTCGHYRMDHFELKDYTDLTPAEVGCTHCDCKEFVLGTIEMKGAR